MKKEIKKTIFWFTWEGMRGVVSSSIHVSFLPHPFPFSVFFPFSALNEGGGGGTIDANHVQNAKVVVLILEVKLDINFSSL